MSEHLFTNNPADPEATAARGRNGYFQPHRAMAIEDYDKRGIYIEIESKRLGGMSPIYLHVTKADAVAFARMILKEAEGESVTVVVRHPEHEDQIEHFGSGPNGRDIEIDLGRGFDVTRIDRLDAPAIREWAEGMRAEVADLPTEHPARKFVEEQVLDVEAMLDEELEEVTA